MTPAAEQTDRRVDDVAGPNRFDPTASCSVLPPAARVTMSRACRNRAALRALLTPVPVGADCGVDSRPSAGAPRPPSFSRSHLSHAYAQTACPQLRLERARQRERPPRREDAPRPPPQLSRRAAWTSRAWRCTLTGPSTTLPSSWVRVTAVDCPCERRLTVSPGTARQASAPPC